MKHVFVENNGTMRLLGEYLRKGLARDDAVIISTRVRTTDSILHLRDYSRRSTSDRFKRYDISSFRQHFDERIGSEGFVLHLAHISGVFAQLLHCHPQRLQTVFLEEGLVSYGPRRLSFRSYVLQCYRAGPKGLSRATRFGRDYVPTDVADMCVGLTDFSWPQMRNRRIVPLADVFTSHDETDALVFLLGKEIPVSQQMSDIEHLRMSGWATRQLIVSVHPGLESAYGVAHFKSLLPDARVVGGAERHLKSGLVAGYASSGLLYAAALGTPTVTLKSVPAVWPEPLRPTVDLTRMSRQSWAEAIESLRR